ncbi:unnamed protein product [Prunus armeniaca]
MSVLNGWITGCDLRDESRLLDLSLQGLGTIRSVLFSLACQNQGELAQHPLRASILLQERPPNGFSRLGLDSFIAVVE